MFADLKARLKKFARKQPFAAFMVMMMLIGLILGKVFFIVLCGVAFAVIMLVSWMMNNDIDFDIDL